MPESITHRRLKRKAAGPRGRTEKRIKRTRQRIDASSPIKDSEIERSGTVAGLTRAIKKLKKSRKPQRVLSVLQEDLKKTVKIAKKLKAKITIRNLGGTKYRKIQ